MRSVATAFGILVVSASIGGCASMTADANRYDSNIDVQKVSAVDQAARSRNLEVHWVRYPTRKTPPVATGPDAATGS